MSGAVPASGSVALAMLAPVLLGPILSEARDRKIELSAIFRGLQIDASDFETPGSVISHQDAMAVVRRALKLMPLAECGLDLGRHAKITERGALALGQLAAATLGEAVSLSVRFAPSAGHLLQVWEEPSPGGRSLVAEPLPEDRDLQRFLAELTFSVSVQLRRQITTPRYTPSGVEFVFERTGNANAHEDFFGCPVHYGCLRNALHTQDDWLDFRLPWANVMAYRMSLLMLERESDRLTGMPAVGFGVARAIRKGLPDITDCAQVAEMMLLSERTLRRQLAQAGLSYRHLLDESRKARALDLMAAGQRPIAEIAAAAGFTDAGAFARAFKRWTGRSPSQIRAYVATARHEPPPEND